MKDRKAMYFLHPLYFDVNFHITPMVITDAGEMYQTDWAWGSIKQFAEAKQTLRNLIRNKNNVLLSEEEQDEIALMLPIELQAAAIY